MNKKDAITALKELIVEVQVNDWEDGDSPLRTRFASTIEQIFGTNSEQHIYSAFYPMSEYRAEGQSEEQFAELVNKAKARNIKFLNDCIRQVETLGLKSESDALKHNYLSRMSDTWLTTILTVSASAIFSLGHWFGSNGNKSEEINQLKATVSAYEDSLSRVNALGVPNRVPHKDTNDDKNDTGGKYTHEKLR